MVEAVDVGRLELARGRLEGGHLAAHEAAQRAGQRARLPGRVGGAKQQLLQLSTPRQTAAQSVSCFQSQVRVLALMVN